MAAATTTLCLLLVATLLAFSQPAAGYRRGMLSSSGGLIVNSMTRHMLQDEGSDNPCGQFPADDPFDGARNGQTPNYHQPCRDSSGVVRFCCASGTTQCACPPTPPTAAGPFGCFNYVAGNTLNANTNQECGFTLLPSSSDTPSPTATSTSTPTSSPTTPAPTNPTPTTPAPTVGPPAGCQTAPSSGSPGADGTCGYDPSGQAFNLCSTAAGIQFCCPQGYVCPTAVSGFSPSNALQVYCQLPGPCGY